MVFDFFRLNNVIKILPIYFTRFICMEMIEWVISNLIIFEIVTNLIEVTIGAGMCFGALKWKKGLLTTTAIGCGLVAL